MRLEVLNTGYGIRTRTLFKLIEVFTRQPLPDAAKLTFYRPDFYGTPMKRLTQEAMRGDSPWTVGERELMAAYVSARNACQFCIGAHTATAGQSLGKPALVSAVLADLDPAPIEPVLRETLRMLGNLATRQTIQASDMRAVLAAGASRRHVLDALAVAFSFNVTNRLADAFGFEHLTPDGYASGAKYLLKRGYA
jgi:uncharacterized peroxidase-related enzyme